MSDLHNAIKQIILQSLDAEGNYIDVEIIRLTKKENVYRVVGNYTITRFLGSILVEGKFTIRITDELDIVEIDLSE